MGEIEYFLTDDLAGDLAGDLADDLTGDVAGDLEGQVIFAGLAVAGLILSLKSTTRSSGFSTKTLLLERLGELVLALLRAGVAF